MKSNKMLTFFPGFVLVAGCGGGGGSSSSSASSGGSNAGAAPNVLAVTVNDPSYPNKPTVSVTVCVPGTSNCQTINHVLVDTGSYGFRIFRQALSGITLPQVNAASVPAAEWIAHADGQRCIRGTWRTGTFRKRI